MAIVSVADKLTRIVEINNEARYFEALGAFIHQFSIVEGAIHGLLARKAGVDLKTANALFSGVKADKATDFIRRLAEARTGKRDVDPELEDAFARLTTLNSARNEIVHYGAHVKAGDARYVSTRSKSITAKKATLRAVSPTILGHMAHDASKLHLIFSIIDSDPGGHLRDVFAEELASPWQYKPETKSLPVKVSRRHKGRQKPARPQRGPSLA